MISNRIAQLSSKYGWSSSTKSPVNNLIGLYATFPNAKLTFATKFVNREMLNYDPQRKTRIRFSLMPHQMSKLVDVRTTPIRDRIAVMQAFREAG